MLLRLLLALIVGAVVPGFAADNSGQFREIVLRDQFEQLHWFEAASNAVTVVTLADHEGAKEVDGWVEAVKREFGGRVAQLGIADVSGAPAPMRPFIRKKFREAYAKPVLLDWKGEVVGLFPSQKKRANVLVISKNGKLLGQFNGPVNDADLATLRNLLRAALGETNPPLTPPPASRPGSTSK